MPTFDLHTHLTTLHRRWQRQGKEGAVSERFRASPVLVSALGSVLDAPGSRLMSKESLGQEIVEAIAFHGSGIDEYAKWELRACLMDHAVLVPVLPPADTGSPASISRAERRLKVR